MKRIRNHVNPLSISKENQVEKFDNNKNVIIDVGSYRGEFGERLLEKFGEERNFIFFEIRKPFYEYLKNKFKENKNIQVFDGDAGRSLKKMIQDLKENNNFVEKIFINFPDPWFKKKHHKRRFLNEKSLTDFYEVLDDESEIIFQTDQKELFKDSLKLVKKTKLFSIKKFSKSIWDIKTYWEEMKIKEGSKIYRMRLKKKKKNQKWWFF